MKLKELEDKYKPRERLINQGVTSLNDYELLAVILNTGTKNIDVLELAENILNNYNISDLINISYENLLKFKGINKRKATLLIALFEFVKRCKKNNYKRLDKVIKIFDFIKSDFLYLKEEKLIIIFLDNKFNYLKKIEFNNYEVDKVEINYKYILKEALLNQSYGIILCHNHPSGNIIPSNEDIKNTNNLISKLNMLDIKLLDHLIIYEDTYYSFLEHNILINLN